MKQLHNWVLPLLFLGVLCSFSGCAEKSSLPQNKSYLPYLAKSDASPSPSPTPSSTPQPTLSPTPLPSPKPTATRPANPYFPIVKTLIDVGPGAVGDIGLNTQNNTAYVRNYDRILPIRNGIPDFEHSFPVPYAGRGNIIVDEKREKIYVLSENSSAIEDEGVSIFDANEQFLKFIPLEGIVVGMVFEPNQGLVYIYGYPKLKVTGGLITGDRDGILMILEETSIIEKIDLRNVRFSKSAVDPSTGHVYFASQYDPPVDRIGTSSSYGRIDVYSGTVRIKTYDPMFTNIHSMVYQPKHQTLNVYTGNYQSITPYDTTIFYNSEIVSQTLTLTGTLHGGIKGGIVYSKTNELYLVNADKIGIMSDEVVPRLKRIIELSGRDVGFEEIIVDPFSGNVYLNNWYDGTLTIIHDEEIIGMLRFNRDLSYMALNPNNGDLYLSNGHTGYIWILGFDEQTVFPKTP